MLLNGREFKVLKNYKNEREARVSYRAIHKPRGQVMGGGGVKKW